MDYVISNRVSKTPGVVHATLAYYLDNVQEINYEFDAEKAAGEQLTRHPTKLPGMKSV